MLLPLVQLPLLATLALAVPYKRDTTTDGAAVASQSFDYVIAGGGLTGIVVARRLAEANWRVLLVEAGGDEEGNDLVTDASKYTQSWDGPIDWAFETTPQGQGGGKTTKVRAGKGLGGSTLINGMAWSKPHNFQLDDLETLGNQGLNWNALAPLMRSVETFHDPSSAQTAAGLTFDGSCHGRSGPIGVRINPQVPAQLEKTFNATGVSLMPYQRDLTCGNPAGLGPIAHNNYNNRRSDTYQGYLWQQNFPSLTILTHAVVGRVLLSGTRATGVELRDQSGSTYSISAAKEVLVAAGSIRTPVLLQHSGIGPRSFLQSAGVNVVVDLPVGQNLIDQTMTSTSFQFNGQASGGGQSILFPRFSDIAGGDSQRLTSLLQANLDKWAQEAVDAGASGNKAGLLKALTLQRDWILNDGAAVGESFDWTGGNSLNYDTWYLLPFGRGFVRISNNDPYSSNFQVDPRFFTNEFDRLATAATLRYTRTYSRKSPLSGMITNESKPGSGTGDSLEDWLAFALNDWRSNYHPIGTCSMQPRADGGVVDSAHKVYGVQGLRVLDASVLPFQVSSHLMTVLYGLAERAAQLIKQDACSV